MAIDLHGYKRILVYGGSFDPPHRLHTVLPNVVASAIKADLIAYVPAGRAPHKLDREQTDPVHRLAMLRIAIEHTHHQVPTTILTDEIDRDPGQPSYTVDTLEALHRRIDKDAELRLLIGGDQLQIFKTWRDWQRVIELAEPVVVVRPPDTKESLLASLPDEEQQAWSKRFVKAAEIDFSSTQIRELKSKDESIEGYVVTNVANYIDEHKLYQ